MSRSGRWAGDVFRADALSGKATASRCSRRIWPTPFGVAAVTGNSATVKRSVLAGNNDTGVETDAGAQIDVDDNSITNNTTGVQANGTIRLSNSDILYNGTAVTGAGSPQTYGNNRVAGNAALDIALVAASPGQQ
jgi:hypothetical protein